MQKVAVYFSRLILIGLILGLGGCQIIADRCRAVFRRSSSPVDTSVVAEWWEGPRISPGINLVIQVGTVSTPPASMTCLVDQNGDITLPLLLQESVACDGLTLEELKQKLIKAYSVYYRQPQVTVTFGPYDGKGVSPWGTVTVLGEVGRPGPVNMPATMNLTVTKILQEAGGLKPYADKTNIQVTRCDKEGNQTRYRVNLNEIGKDGRVDKDMRLRAGDVVYVYESLY